MGPGFDSGEGEVENASFTFLALHPDAATVSFHDGFHRGQTQAHPLQFARLRALDPIELLEDVSFRLSGDPHARVLHRHYAFAPALRGRYSDPAPLRSVADGVVQQVRHYLAQSRRGA